MRLLLKETEANFKSFDAAWRQAMDRVGGELAKEGATFLTSYRRLVSLQAWRAFLQSRISASSLAFFLEAQNDALVSHVFANLGSWRAALKSLRSCIENVAFCLYYKDHPVEFQLWETGKHKPPISDYLNYLEHHPQRVTVASVDPIPHLQTEYSTLSKAVHASAKSFRMTKDVKTTQLWNEAKASLGQWQTREGAVLANLNLLLLAHFRDQIGGAAEPGLRESIGLAVAPTLFPDIKTNLNVVLRKS
jgi:hypothetical protein